MHMRDLIEFMRSLISADALLETAGKVQMIPSLPCVKIGRNLPRVLLHGSPYHLSAERLAEAAPWGHSAPFAIFQRSSRGLKVGSNSLNTCTASALVNS